MANQLRISILILSLIFSSFSFADNRRHSFFDDLRGEIAEFESACPGDVCQAPFAQQLIYDAQDGINQISAQLQNRLLRIADEQAQSWGDTILEGDYYADGNVRLDSVVAIYRDNQVMAYRISYSERAWNTADCSFDGSEVSLNECHEGRISEGSYVSPSGIVFVNDENRYAEFFD